jgi:hypothetical protein
LQILRSQTVKLFKCLFKNAIFKISSSRKKDNTLQMAQECLNTNGLKNYSEWHTLVRSFWTCKWLYWSIP